MLLRLGPADRARRHLRQRRVAVPMRQPLLAEPSGLERIIAMRQPRIGGAHRRDQRIDHFALDPVVQCRASAMSAKPRQRSEISLSLASVLVISANCCTLSLNVLRQRLGGGLALCAGAILQQIERRLDGERLARDLEAQIGDGRVEQPVPRGIRRHRLFVKQLLDAIFELIGPVAAHVLEPRPVMAERRIGHRGFEQRIVDAVEFEREKQTDASRPRSAAPARRRRTWCAPDRRVSPACMSPA